MGKNFRGQAAIESAAPIARRQHGQAAMEYLVTYGWALLALFAVIAFLVSSDMFSSNSFTSQECTFQPDLPCPAFILYNSSSGTVLQFSLVNGLGFPIKVTNMSYIATNTGQPGRQQYAVDQSELQDVNVSSGQYLNFTYTFAGPQQPLPKSSRQILVSITYQNCKPPACSGNYTTSGRISALVQQG